MVSGRLAAGATGVGGVIFGAGGSARSTFLSWRVMLNNKRQFDFQILILNCLIRVSACEFASYLGTGGPIGCAEGLPAV